MNLFTLKDIKHLIGQALLELPTENKWLDDRYREQVTIIGHTNPYYKLFYLISQVLKPELVIELGAWQATGAAHFACGYPMGEVITVDHHTDPGDDLNKLKVQEAENNCPNLTYLQMWSWDAIKMIASLEKRIDIYFCDSWHDWEHVNQDWNLYSPFLNDGALLIFDDLFDNGGMFEGMEKFWEELPYEKFTDARLHPGIPMGFAVFKKEGLNGLEQDRTVDTIKPATTRKRGRPRTNP